jgi:hypothetical protein
MGDHRVGIKIEFDAHGKEYKTEMDINYWPDDYSGVDHRVAEWFQQCWEDALGRYNKLIYDSKKEQREREEKEHELKELKRLKEKYEL